ncbi:hypothetical protein AQI84_21875 [Streptomyces griseorubiginosus]|uniref:Uncharacterized protein n=1 Tax=Streptomyces griseorubiginosus TaxID=67304 RepID=A0A117P788_9ACTN|nr:hypothetical protein AQI84_21875 [Streptomyces griseorubiginosus]KUN64022.1 hypothetical protein AQJ54_23525 [Streptomyces griseorubiginosus]
MDAGGDRRRRTRRARVDQGRLVVVAPEVGLADLRQTTVERPPAAGEGLSAERGAVDQLAA